LIFLRPGIFVSKAQSVMEDGLVNLMHEFIINRTAYIEVEGHTSCSFGLPVGCPQGSTLGPKVFNIYCRDLADQFGDHSSITSYADDSYVIVSEESRDKLLKTVKDTLTNHLDWLARNGMVCNVAKTELMMMKDEEQIEIEVDGKSIKSSPSMKVLGLTFDKELNWEHQIRNTINRSNQMYHGMKKLRRLVSLAQAKVMITSYYFSVLYYGIEVWFHRGLGFNLKRKIRSAHYRALRVIYGDITRDELDQRSERATPDEWADYCLAKMAAKMMILMTPERLFETTLPNSFSETRQPGRVFFFDSSVRKIGRQRLINRLPQIAKRMDFRWLECSVQGLRPKLKKCFFKYAKTIDSKNIQ
jgi:hypothetical protein